MGVIELTARLIVVAWLFISVTSMAMLGGFHTAAVWCDKYSTPTNPACRLVKHVLIIEGH
jgi:hypothetical protein